MLHTTALTGSYEFVGVSLAVFEPNLVLQNCPAVFFWLDMQEGRKGYSLCYLQ